MRLFCLGRWQVWLALLLVSASCLAWRWSGLPQHSRFDPPPSQRLAAPAPSLAAPVTAVNVASAAATALQVPAQRAALAHLPLHFEALPETAQAAPAFVARGAGYRLALTAQEVRFSLRPGSPARPAFLAKDHAPAAATTLPPAPAELRMRLVGANAHAPLQGVEPLAGRSHYMLGQQPAAWRREVQNFARVKVADVYPGISLVYYGQQQQLEYDFVVEPQADPQRIRLQFSGAERMRLTSAGELVLQVGTGEVRQPAPQLYQEIQGERRRVSGRYVQRGAFTVGFEIGAYDRNLPLVIDPVILYATLLGGNFQETIHSLITDAAGNIYFVGETQSLDFPVVNPLQAAKKESETLQCAVRGGCTDILIGKLNPAGTALLFATYLGGSYNDIGLSLALDAQGSVYLTGTTLSTDFPVTPGAFQPLGAGRQGIDAFVTKLSPAGNQLVYSSYLGGSTTDRGFALAVDEAGQAWVAGRTNSVDFPLAQPWQASNSGLGDVDGFLAKVSSDGTQLLVSTYWGGSDDDQINALALDRVGNVYVTGSTVSVDFPTTSDVFQRDYQDSDEVFVSKFSSQGEPLFSTYVGGTSGEVGNSLSLDAQNNIYVAGYSGTLDGTFSFPLVNPVQRESHWFPNLGPGIDVIVFKLSADGRKLLYSTYLGGSLLEYSSGRIAVDGAGRIYLTGSTESLDFPVTPDALQSNFGSGLFDAFLVVLDPARSGWDALRYSSYFGGRAHDYGLSVALDPAGSVVLGGLSYTFDPPNDFPTVNALQAQMRGDGDGFIAKFALGARAGADQTPPTLQILQPTPNSEWATGQARLSLAGTAADNVGVTEVFWRREQTDADLATGITWARAEGAANWKINEVFLQTGVNRIQVIARDAAGNASTATLTVRYQPAYTINTYAGGGGSLASGQAATGVFFQSGILAVATDAAGNLYCSGGTYGSNVNTRAVWKINPAGVATRIAGTGRPGITGDGGPALEATLNAPYGLAVDAAGNVYISDDFYGLVRMVNAAGIINTVAGDKQNPTCGFAGDGGPALAARFCQIRGLVFDRAGNLYLADSGNQRVRRIDTKGIVTTIAGTGEAGFSGDGGPATQAQLINPTGLALDREENLYIADYGNARVRRVGRDGVIRTVAGGGTRYPNEGGLATETLLLTPQGLAFDGAGNLLISGPDGDRVRRVTPTGFIESLAGLGEPGFTGDGGAALLARLTDPYGLAVDAQGRIFIADSGNRRVRVLTPQPPTDTRAPVLRITTPTTNASVTVEQPWLTLAGTASDNVNVAQVKWANDRGGSGIANGTTFWRTEPLRLSPGSNQFVVTAKDAAGNSETATLTVVYVQDTTPPVVRITTPTSANSFTATTPTVTLSGTASDNLGLERLSWRDARGFRGELAVGSPWTLPGYELHAGLNQFTLIAEDVAGNAGTATLALTYQPEYLIDTVAGPGSGAFQAASLSPQWARNAWINQPDALALDAAGNLYFSSVDAEGILKISPDGFLSLLPLNTTERLGRIGGLAFDAAGVLHFSGLARVYKVSAAGQVTPVAGNGVEGFSGDGGLALQAQLSGPAGLVFDAAGNLYIADRLNSRIRKVAPNGIITTIAGGLAAANLGDGGPAALAQLAGPTGLALDAAGNLYIADTGTSRIRKIAPNGIITSVAGSGSYGGGFAGDGGPATAAQLLGPRGVALDAAGNLYIADTLNHRIRRVNAAGVITTIAGNGPAPAFQPTMRGDGDAATYARLQSPTSLVLDRFGTLYFTDQDNQRLRKLVRTAAGPNAALANVSAASYSAQGLAPGAVVAAFGTAFAARAQSAVTLPLPTVLGDTRVLVRDSRGQERAAPLFFVSPTQINYQMPEGSASGSATITVFKSNGEHASGAASLGRIAPGLFAANANGQGVAAAVALRVKANGQQVFEPVALLDPARNRFVPAPLDLGPADEQVFLILFGTGWRNRRSLSEVTAQLGGLTLPATFAGAQGSLVGLDQINLLLPRTLRGRGELELRLQVEGTLSNAVTVSIR